MHQQPSLLRYPEFGLQLPWPVPGLDLSARWKEKKKRYDAFLTSPEPPHGAQALQVDLEGHHWLHL